MELVPKTRFSFYFAVPSRIVPNRPKSCTSVYTRSLNIYLNSMLVTVFMFVLDTNPYRKLALKKPQRPRMSLLKFAFQLTTASEVKEFICY